MVLRHRSYDPGVAHDRRGTPALAIQGASAAFFYADAGTTRLAGAAASGIPVVRAINFQTLPTRAKTKNTKIK